MIIFPNNLKASRLQATGYKLNQGMTYVELIVVLSIFSVMSSIVLFNHGAFQAKVDIKNLTSDIALRIVEAQKSALSGKWPPLSKQSLISDVSVWKPSYGVYFNTVGDDSVDNKSFIYFTDIDSPAQNGVFDNYGGLDCSGECLDKVTITKGNTISRLDVFYKGDSSPYSLNDLTVAFKRPNSRAIINSNPLIDPVRILDYVRISVASPSGTTGTIKLYPSGRLQVN